MQKLLILQWGKERSIVQYASFMENTIFIIDNQLLMNYDEMGMVHDY